MRRKKGLVKQMSFLINLKIPKEEETYSLDFRKLIKVYQKFYFMLGIQTDQDFSIRVLRVSLSKDLFPFAHIELIENAFIPLNFANEIISPQERAEKEESIASLVADVEPFVDSVCDILSPEKKDQSTQTDDDLPAISVPVGVSYMLLGQGEVGEVHMVEIRAASIGPFQSLEGIEGIEPLTLGYDPEEYMGRSTLSYSLYSSESN